MAKRKTVLIFGVSSFLGSNLAETLKKDYRVIGTYNETPVEIPGVQTHYCDVLDRDRINFILLTFRPQYTIYAAGLHSVELAHTFPKLADALNTVGLVNVTKICEKVGSKICYISSGFVFPGEDVSYSEKDNPLPSTLFGKAKLAGEFFIQKSSLNYLIIRSCILYGRGVNHNHRTWFEALEQNVSDRVISNLDDRIYAGFLDVTYLGAVLKLCFDLEVTNRLLQLSSTDIMTHFSFGKLYCKKFNRDDKFLNKGNWFYPINDKTGTVMETLKFRLLTENIEDALNISVPSVEESLELTGARMNFIPTKEGERNKKRGTIDYL